MIIRDLLKSDIGEVIYEGSDLEREISHPFCCDLLSLALSKAGEGSAWVTVMGNVNTLAVASLTEVSCIILAEGADLDEAARERAREGDICVIRSPLSIFDAALKIYQLIHD